MSLVNRVENLMSVKVIRQGQYNMTIQIARKCGNYGSYVYCLECRKVFHRSFEYGYKWEIV